MSIYKTQYEFDPDIVKFSYRDMPDIWHGSDQHRTATLDDLPKLNQVVRRAVATWHISDRVKRLTGPLFEADAMDLQLGEWIVFDADNGDLIGAAHWSNALKGDIPAAVDSAAILHGLYVDPSVHRSGFGSYLLQAVARAAYTAGQPALVVHVQRDAEPFFVSQQFVPLPGESEGPTYPRGLWRILRAGDNAPQGSQSTKSVDV